MHFRDGVFLPKAKAGLRSLAIAAMMAAATLATAKDAVAEKYAAIIVDAKTGATLFASNADAQRFPASLTKMMTLFLTFEALESGKITMQTRFKVSAQAAAQAPSKLGLKVNSTIAVKDAIMALITKSANDVAVVVAEGLGGSEQNFARMMTARAKQIGMTKSQFRNASGLPNSGQLTTARDMATLGRALQDTFPQYFKLFSTRSYSYQGRRYGNHNRLLGRVEGVDGIKTGYTRASGFNLVASVQRDGRSIVAVVLGGKTARSRDDHMASIIAKYISKATRGPKTDSMLVASSGVEFAPQVAAAEVIPMPKPRPSIPADAIAVASIAPAAAPQENPIEEFLRLAEGDADTDADPAPAMNPVAMTFAALDQGSLAAITPPAPVPAPQPEASAAAAPVAEPAAQPVAASLPDGWKIQIGAMPAESGALAMIEKARKAMPQLLADVSPYTEPVTKGSATLYRARFAGFTSKEDARNACTKLQSEGFKCLALQ